ncbi:MAG: hypothetical protein R2706_12335 [Acidimicrobiales bacterium]
MNGYGWPVYTGGPMFWADTVGLPEVLAKIEEYNERIGGRHWEPAALLKKLVAEGGRLSG